MASWKLALRGELIEQTLAFVVEVEVEGIGILRNPVIAG